MDLEDLSLVLTIDPDTMKFERAMADMGSLIDDIADVGLKKIKGALTEITSDMAKDLANQKVLQESILALEDPRLSSLREQLNAAKDMTAEMQHQMSLKEIQAQMEPKALASYKISVEKAKELADAQKDLNRERSRPGFFQKLMSDPGGTIKDINDGIGKIFSGMKKEYSKGGVGGVMDVAAGAAKGGGGGLSGLTGAVVGGAAGGGAGAAAGALAGGPITIAVTAALEGLKLTGKMAAAPISALVGGLDLLGGSLKSLQGPLGPIGMGLDLIDAGFSNLKGMLGGAAKEIAGPFLDALGAVPGAVKGILETLTSFAAKASPAVIQQFNFALEDVQGVIGGSFLPVLEMMRDGVRLFGDVLANILPNSSEVREALSELRSTLGELGTEIRKAMVEVGPSIREGLIGALKILGGALSIMISVLIQVGSFIKEHWPIIVGLLIPPLILVGVVIGTLALSIALVLAPLILLALAIAAPFIALGVAIVGVIWAVKKLLQLFGLIEESAPSTAGEARSSSGAASRQASFSSFDEYQKKLQLEAFKQPGSSMDQVPSMIGGISGTLSEINAWTKNLTVESFALAIVKAMAPPGVGAATDAAKSASNWLANKLLGR